MYLPLSYLKAEFSLEEALEQHKRHVKENETLLRRFGLEFATGKMVADENEDSYVVAFESGTIDLNETQRSLYMQLLESFAQTWKESK